MLTRWVDKIKSWFGEYKTDLFLGISIFLISVGSFGLGRLSAVWEPHSPTQITGSQAGNLEFKHLNIEAPQQLEAAASGVVASKNGASYHLPDCPGAKQIKPENLISFADAKAVVAAGYKPAGNCPGLAQ